MITKEQKNKWLEALRSGNYKKGTKALYNYINGKVDSYCCLGVYCAAVKGDDPNDGFINARILESTNVVTGENTYLKIEFYDEILTELRNMSSFDKSYDVGADGSAEYYLAELNDITDSFDRVAYYIEKYYPTID